jgi:hypothetical protein
MSGSYVLPLSARTSGRYAVQIPGSYSRLAGTASVNVHVHSAVSIRLSSNVIKPGQSVTVLVGVNPRIKGQRVLRQFYTGGKWITSASATTNSSGVALFAFKPTGLSGAQRYRITTEPARGFAAGRVYFTVVVRH